MWNRRPRDFVSSKPGLYPPRQRSSLALVSMLPSLRKPKSRVHTVVSASLPPSPRSSRPRMSIGHILAILPPCSHFRPPLGNYPPPPPTRITLSPCFDRTPKGLVARGQSLPSPSRALWMRWDLPHTRKFWVADRCIFKLTSNCRARRSSHMRDRDVTRQPSWHARSWPLGLSIRASRYPESDWSPHTDHRRALSAVVTLVSVYCNPTTICRRHWTIRRCTSRLTRLRLRRYTRSRPSRVIIYFF